MDLSLPWQSGRMNVFYLKHYMLNIEIYLIIKCKFYYFFFKQLRLHNSAFSIEICVMFNVKQRLPYLRTEYALSTSAISSVHTSFGQDYLTNLHSPSKKRKPTSEGLYYLSCFMCIPISYMYFSDVYI
jgi:hypothetical protein